MIRVRQRNNLNHAKIAVYILQILANAISNNEKLAKNSLQELYWVENLQKLKNYYNNYNYVS